ncbi:hypothetical protein ROE7235_03683 [Roseibaca ekhonensis]|uniref:Uncharacterized protein n=1 Tax=Roseinatronobacter ekhonensis TaxID=254356 RepID=A0A3B0MDL3_9RHOB|nr:hypothetical protein ROE7235_03683 [Roseibaca ekhonensis]
MGQVVARVDDSRGFTTGQTLFMFPDRDRDVRF